MKGGYADSNGELRQAELSMSSDSELTAESSSRGTGRRGVMAWSKMDTENKHSKLRNCVMTGLSLLIRYVSINLPAKSEALTLTPNTGQERSNFFIALGR
jgi:hypothetical protein